MRCRKVGKRWPLSSLQPQIVLPAACPAHCPFSPLSLSFCLFSPLLLPLNPSPACAHPSLSQAAVISPFLDPSSEQLSPSLLSLSIFSCLLFSPTSENSKCQEGGSWWCWLFIIPRTLWCRYLLITVCQMMNFSQPTLLLRHHAD